MKPMLIAVLAVLSAAPAVAAPLPPVETPFVMNAQTWRAAVDAHKRDIAYRTARDSGVSFSLPPQAGQTVRCISSIASDANPAAEARLDFVLNRSAYEAEAARARRTAAGLQTRRTRDALLDVESDYSEDEEVVRRAGLSADRLGAAALGAREAYIAFAGDPVLLMMTPSELVRQAEYRVGDCPDWD